MPYFRRFNTQFSALYPYVRYLSAVLCKRLHTINTRTWFLKLYFSFINPSQGLSGSVVAISSVLGQVGTGGLQGYCSTKAAVIGMPPDAAVFQQCCRNCCKEAISNKYIVMVLTTCGNHG